MNAFLCNALRVIFRFLSRLSRTLLNDVTHFMRTSYGSTWGRELYFGEMRYERYGGGCAKRCEGWGGCSQSSDATKQACRILVPLRGALSLFVKTGSRCCFEAPCDTFVVTRRARTTAAFVPDLPTSRASKPAPPHSPNQWSRALVELPLSHPFGGDIFFAESDGCPAVQGFGVGMGAVVAKENR